jgi:hypothetical protein
MMMQPNNPNPNPNPNPNVCSKLKSLEDCMISHPEPVQVVSCPPYTPLLVSCPTIRHVENVLEFFTGMISSCSSSSCSSLLVLSSFALGQILAGEEGLEQVRVLS